MDDIVKQKGLYEFWDSSQLAGHNAAYLEDLYEQFLADPNRVSDHWRAFFETLPRVNGNGAEAVSRAKEALYDLVILDVGLPDTDGRLVESAPVPAVEGRTALNACGYRSAASSTRARLWRTSHGTGPAAVRRFEGREHRGALLRCLA